MRQISVPGVVDPFAKAQPPVAGEAAAALVEAGFQVEVEKGYRVEASRSAAPARVGDVADDTVVEIELDGGAVFYARADALPERLRLPQARAGTGAGDAIELPAVLPLGASDRGIGDWAIRALRFLVVKVGERAASDVIEGVAEHAARRAARAIERRQVPRPGLKRWQGKELIEPEGALPGGAGPWLVFLHGTASSTLGSFGGLAERETEWRQLTAAYGDRILALEHHTLTVSPVRNAIDAMEALPEGATLHLVSHSRGGLVGELLCLGGLVDGKDPLPADELARFDEDEEGRKALEELRRLLAEKRPLVERFVRVACPARGTILASERLDLWLNVALNALGLAVKLAPAPGLSEAYGFLKALTIAVVKEKADPATLPGLEAMIPGKPLVRLLNRVGATTKADLSVIEGDIEGAGVLGRLKVFATDLFYRTDHDLVVNTSSMTGGMARPKDGARVYPDKGAAVSHFAYFRNPWTAELVVRGLLRKGGDHAGFKPLEASRDIPMPAVSARRDGARRPLVFVLPGTMGSHLAVNGQRTWLDVPRLAAGGAGALAMGAAGVAPEAPIGLYYAELCEHLARTHEVRPWAYDWRLSVRSTGPLLAQAVRDAMAATDKPVRIVAHSLGALVARSAFLDGDLWQQFRDRKGCRLVMLGAPNGGSHAIPLMLLGRDRTSQALAMLDVTRTRKQLLELVSRFPSVLEMLPPPDDGLDFLTGAAWSRLAAHDSGGAGWAPPVQADLDSARETRAALDTAPVDTGLMLYVAGHAPTPDRLLFQAEAGGAGRRLVFGMTHEGDGRVPWKTGILPGMRAWYAAAAHGDLPRSRPAFAAIADLLEQGTTNRLPQRPPGPGSAFPPRPIARELPTIHPDFEEMAAAALGGTRTPPAAPSSPGVRITVVHGHVAMAEHPVVVGHYEGDTIAGPEWALDRLLDGRLSKRRRLGLYPGRRGTSEVMLDRRRRPEGAVVLGLGTPGELTGGLLEEVYATGFLRYAAAVEEEWCARGRPEARRLRLATVLVGSGEGGLSTREAVRAMVLGLGKAQRALRGGPTYVELQVVELFEHRAIEAWHELDRLAKGPDEAGRMVELAPKVSVRDGGRRRLAEEGDPSWWQPLQVTVEKHGAQKLISFAAPSGRARVEASVLAYNQTVVDLFSAQATAPAGADPEKGTPGRALFELLWPDRLKDRSGEDHNLRLILDEETAAFPWEMMDDRRPWQRRVGDADGEAQSPPAVRAGAVRQLIRKRFRDRPQVVPGSRPRALVVGNPTAIRSPGFRPLPGAEEEAKAVASLLTERGYTVEPLIGRCAAPDRILKTLFAEAWQIVHIAAHGAVKHRFRDDRPAETGVILGGEFVLGPDILERMPVPPDLAFINCCHIGSVDRPGEAARDRNKAWPQLAATVSVQLIEIGTRAVVAAGWAVDDTAARVFAEEFYRRLLDGGGFGDAVKGARARIYKDHPHTTTWGAYQCYGEPDWRLTGGKAAGTEPKPRPFAAAAEVLNAVENIRGDAQTGVERDVEKLKARLAEVVGRAEQAGFDARPEVAALLGAVSGELGDLEGAVRRYDVAMSAEKADLAVRAIEQRANLRARLAVRRFREAGPAPAGADNPRAEIGRSLRELEQLVALAGRTSERAALMGGCHKRLAQISAGDERKRALQSMKECYAAAEEIGRERAGRSDPYHTLMRAAAVFALELRGGGTVPPDALAALGPAEEEAKRLYAAEASFWTAIAGADARLLRHVASAEGIGSLVEDAAPAYLDAWRRNGSVLMMHSVLEQIEFFIDVLSDAPDAPDRLQPLSALRNELRIQMSTAFGPEPPAGSV